MTIAGQKRSIADNLPEDISLANGRKLSLARPLIMGIINVTPDSFSDGDGSGIATPFKATEIAIRMLNEGADIIDIGGESTRPGADPVSLDEELRRVIPAIKAIREKTNILISIDTYKAETASAAIEAGADIVNDISALRFDSKMAEVVNSKDVPVVLMHMLGTPRDMQKNPVYENCLNDIVDFFKERIAYCEKHDIKRQKIILDPGIGFGKRLTDNLVIFSNISSIKALGFPVLIGASRKSFINMIYPSDKESNKRIGGSIAAAITAVLNGASIIRVHDVEETVEALKVLEAIRES
jgi:dihydropteroate synthase